MRRARVQFQAHSSPSVAEFSLCRRVRTELAETGRTTARDRSTSAVLGVARLNQPGVEVLISHRERKETKVRGEAWQRS